MLLQNAFKSQDLKKNCAISYDAVFPKIFLSYQAVLEVFESFLIFNHPNQKMFELIGWVRDWHVESLLGCGTYMVEKSCGKSTDKDFLLWTSSVRNSDFKQPIYDVLSVTSH